MHDTPLKLDPGVRVEREALDADAMLHREADRSQKAEEGKRAGQTILRRTFDEIEILNSGERRHAARQ